MISFYYIIYFVLVISAILEYKNGKTIPALYWISFIILTIVLCFRYGQGSDYFAYYAIYLSSKFPLSASGYDVEVGWKLINAILNTLNVRFEFFVAMLSIIEMGCLNRFIQKFCPQKSLSLMIAFPTLYLTYFFSAFRQGLTIGIFLGFLLVWYTDKKRVKYILGTLFCMLIHKATIVFLLLPLIGYIYKKRNMLVVYVTCGIIFGIALDVTHVLDFITYADERANVFALVERLVSFVFVLMIYRLYDKRYKQRDDIHLIEFTQIYSYGIVMYALLLFAPTIASRMIAPFKMLELSIYSKLSMNKQIKNVIFVFVILMSSVMLVKNIDSYLLTLGLGNNYNVINYPYFTILNRFEAISARSEDVYLQTISKYILYG